MKKGHDPLDAAIEGVGIVEADPKDHSVGLGGLPNEEGVVELDAAVMHGPTHGGGSVASIRNILHPAAVARLVMQRSRHCLLVGEGALRFARAHGFPEVELLTDDGAADLVALEGVSRPQRRLASPARREGRRLHQGGAGKRITGTIHCSVLDTHGDLGCTTTTSGLSWKIPGRVGDSPILGAGLFLDNEVGSAGSTGIGELNLLNLSSALIVENMRRGMGPKDAIMDVCKTIVRRCTKDPKRRRKDGTLAGNVLFYALTKDGKYAGGSIYPGAGWRCTTATPPGSSPATRSSRTAPSGRAEAIPVRRGTARPGGGEGIGRKSGSHPCLPCHRQSRTSTTDLQTGP